MKNLPFSPIKRRARKGIPVHDSEDEGDGVVTTRKSSRTTKNAKASYKEADEYVDDDDDQSDPYDDDKPRKSRSKGKDKAKTTKKIIRGKASRPAYGNFRAVADLDYDALSDEETAPLRAHRNVCEKCHKGPGHALIMAANDKPKGKGRKKQAEIEDEDEGNEMERLIALGGWVRWYVNFTSVRTSYID